MSRKFEEIPIEPSEATDLALHVRNCLQRHTALVRLINDGLRRRDRSDFMSWVYRGVLLPAIGFVAYQLWALRPVIDKMIALGPVH